jgi:hypothetical protein
MMCGRDDELWPSIATRWRIAMVCAHCKIMDMRCGSKKTSVEGIKKDHWQCAIMVCAQAIKNEWKQEWKHPYVSIAKGMKSSLDVHSLYGCVFPWIAMIITCVVVVDACCTIFVQTKSTMMMSIKVWKSFLMIRISTPCQVWWGKRWETSL